MGKTFGFLVLLIVICFGMYLYTKDVQSLTPGGAAPQTMIDVTGVKNDLMAMANAEKRYWVLHAKYASLEELRANGDVHIPTRPSYEYSTEVGDGGFRIVATYSGSDTKAPKRISVDETMALKMN